MDIPRSTPEELIEDLRSSARTESLRYGDDIPIDALVEWEAADWIEAACVLLETIKAAGGDSALTAIELLGGDYPVVADDGSSSRFD